MQIALEKARALLKERGSLLLGIIIFLWVLELFDLIFLRQRLNFWGIQPRTLTGLRGILFAPLLHGGIGHLTANTLPFLILGFFVLLRGLKTFISVSLIVWLIGGLGIWLFGGTNTIHIGLSIIIFGYLGYLLALAYFERSLSALAVAIIVGGLYWTMIFGVLPIRAGMSWQGHLFGFIGGAIAASLGSKKSNG